MTTFPFSMLKSLDQTKPALECRLVLDLSRVYLPFPIMNRLLLETLNLEKVRFTYWALDQEIASAGFCIGSQMNISAVIAILLGREKIRTLNLSGRFHKSTPFPLVSTMTTIAESTSYKLFRNLAELGSHFNHFIFLEQ